MSFSSDDEEENYGKEEWVKPCANNDIRKRATCESVSETGKFNEHVCQSEQLVVTKVLKKDFQIPERTRDRHIYNGPSCTFKTEKALEISERRTGQVWENTVFGNPHEFWACETNMENKGNLIISRDPVKTYQCTCSKDQWTAVNMGKFHAVFEMNGHFPGLPYLFEKIIFPSHY